MYQILILFLWILSVKSWWPWSPQPRDNSPFEYYNYTTGIESIISKDLINEFNPFGFSMLKLFITGIKIPIDDQHFAGAISLKFNDATCHQLQISQDKENPGLYLGDGYIGLAIKFNAKCRTLFKTNVPGAGLMWVNLTLTGVRGNAKMSVNYDSHGQMIVPEAENVALHFDRIDVSVDNHRFLNFVTKSLHSVFPLVASQVFSSAIKQAMKTLPETFKNLRVGWKKSYHPIFLYPAVLTSERIKFNVALAPSKSKDYLGLSDEERDSFFDAVQYVVTEESKE